MLHNLRGRALALLVCASLSAAVVAGCGDDASEDDDASTPPTAVSTATTGAEAAVTSTSAAVGAIEVAFAGGQVQGGRRTERVKLGEQVRIRAVSDVPEELHVHTYDRRVALQPSQPAEVVFTADIPGRHEVEFEKSGRDALTLEVG